ncbi:hypothetical protein BaRGS_00017644 [Batillaria attramentaria]|uniref:RING-type domain-containing protein n=1 Tax=Batillaria attramentaria TaxID=370345 RepID=A0ABD0KWB7_9CAEN
MAKSATSKKLECSVCLDLFNTPKMLPCFHTFCKGCLEELAANSTARSFACPECRKDTEVPGGGVTNFQTNIISTSQMI